MDESSTLERRYSFNMSQGNPAAESTHLNGSSFSWGSFKSPNHRSNSILSLNNKTRSPDCNSKSIGNQRTKYNTKIDARIAADVQSKGLASRIVKYHENGTRLNRSMSAHNIYSKPGQFPAVTLKKIDLPYRATKQELSMIRIPPPEKSSFYGNTISGLLRSSSVIGLQSKRTEELSRENRPIIHPPPTDTDMAPTRSVLDVLKEISRKRINSDDLESEEASKKYCNRSSNDVDAADSITPAIQTNLTTSSLSCQRHKRQRDCITPHQVVQLTETKTSPEQAKKRVCNYNNDITSSLSSSTKYKRILPSGNPNQTMSTNTESFEIQKSKEQHYHDHRESKNNTLVDIRFENLANTLRNVDAINRITPIPKTPYEQDQSNVGGVAAKRSESEPSYNSHHKITHTQPPNKPRLTLFNKQCDDSESAGTSEPIDLIATDGKDLNDLYDCRAIAFVKPKKITSKSGLRNPVMERTQKSKLALMLSGLRGELYQSPHIDELDAPNEKEKSQTLKDNIIIANTSIAIKSTNTATTLNKVTSFSDVEAPEKSNPLNISRSAKSSTSPISTNALENKTSSPLVGLKLSHPNTSSESVTNILNVDATKSTEIQSKANLAPVLGGFSFGATNKSSISLLNTRTSEKLVKDCKTIITPNSSIPTGSINIPNLDQSPQLPSSMTLDKPNKLQFSAVCTIPTTNTSTFSNTTSSSTGSKDFTTDTNLFARVPTSSTCTPVRDNSSFNNVIKQNNAFNVPPTSFPITTTSSMPAMFGTLKSSTALTKTTSTITAEAVTTLRPPSAAVTSENSSLTSTPLFSFSSSNKLLSNEAPSNSSNDGLPHVSFKMDGNPTSTSAPTFETNTYSTTKTLPTSVAFSFSSDTNLQNCSSGDQNVPQISNQNGHDAYISNPSTLFSSQCFDTKATGGSPVIFGKNSENNAFNLSNTTSMFGSSFLKSGTQLESSSNNNSAILVTPTAFGSKNNAGASTPFSFASKSPAIPITSKASTAPGGFSFSSAVTNNEGIGTFGFSAKSSGQTNALKNTFNSSTAPASQNKNFTFGSSTNKSGNPASIFGVAVHKQTENTTHPGGFSFGSTPSIKTSTFSFASGDNSSGNVVSNANNSSTGFTFGASPASKPNEMSANKSFSFGSPQSIQQKQAQSVPTNNANSLNIFGLGDATKTMQQPAFNFNSGSSSNLQPNISTVNNIFSPHSSNITTGPGDRPIRRATRRLQK